MAVATSRKGWCRDWKQTPRKAPLRTLADASLKRTVREKYKDIIGKIIMPPEGLDRHAKREFVSKQLQKHGVSPYNAYFIASMAIKK